jgi:hypothetical protein
MLFICWNIPFRLRPIQHSSTVHAARRGSVVAIARISKELIVPYRSVNPATGEVLKTFTEHTDQEMMEALAATDKAFVFWAALPIDGRAKIISHAAQLLLERKSALAKLATLEMGMHPLRSVERGVLPGPCLSARSGRPRDRTHGPESRKLHIPASEEGKIFVVTALCNWRLKGR